MVRTRERTGRDDFTMRRLNRLAGEGRISTKHSAPILYTNRNTRLQGVRLQNSQRAKRAHSCTPLEVLRVGAKQEKENLEEFEQYLRPSSLVEMGSSILIVARLTGGEI